MYSILSRRVISICTTLVLTFRIDLSVGIGITEALSTELQVPNALRGGRVLNGSTITTPNCSAIRTVQYPAELQLFYSYSVEINDDLLLNDMERAIDNAVVIELDMCDLNGRPVYKVRTSTTHSFSTSGKCDPVVTGNTCIVVNGETAVLLDENSDAAFVRNKVYAGISHGLGDLDFLNGFTNSVVSAALISEGHASLVQNSDQDHERMNSSEATYRSGVTTTVAVAAASVTIVVASIFCYGFMRKPNSHDPSVRHKNRSLRKPTPRTIVSGSQLGVPTRRHFVRLEDLSSSPTSFVTASISPRSYPTTYSEEDAQDYPLDYSEEDYYHEVDYNPTVNWSVSDITSDSASLRSGVSRTPSMLERIEEEIEDEEDDCVDGDGDNSCNFSYSEDSTIITNAISQAGIVRYDDCHSDANDHYRNPPDKNVADSNWASERQDRFLDISELDPCFTILPDNTEDIFRDLEDLSSEGTQDSLLESIVLETKMSTEYSDSDSFKTAISDTSIVSLIPLGDLTKFDLNQEQSYEISIEHINSENIEDSALEPTSPASKNVVFPNRSNFGSQSEKREEVLSLVPTIDEIPVRVTNLSLSEEAGNGRTITASISLSDEDQLRLTSRTDEILTVTGSRNAISISKAELEIYDNETSPNDVSSVSCSSHGSEAKHTSPSLKGNKYSGADTKFKKDTPKNEKIDLISLSSIEGDEAKFAGSSSARIDDEASININTVDSIDEWVSELMNQKPKGEPETTLAKT